MALKKKELEELKNQLLDKRKKIVSHLYKIKSDSEAEIAEISGDSADIASLEMSQSAYSKLGGRERKLLKNNSSLKLKLFFQNLPIQIKNSIVVVSVSSNVALTHQPSGLERIMTIMHETKYSFV